MKCILDENGFIWNAGNDLGIGFVVGEENVVGSLVVEEIIAQAVMSGMHAASSVKPNLGLLIVFFPIPTVVEPEQGQHSYRCLLSSAIGYVDVNGDVLLVVLGISNMNVEVFIVVENSRVEYFIFWILPGSLHVHLAQFVIGEFVLRIFVQVFHVVMRRKIVEVIVEFLHIFAMISLAVSETEESFFENWIFTVPKCNGEAKILEVVGNAGKSIFSPEVCSAV